MALSWLRQNEVLREDERYLQWIYVYSSIANQLEVMDRDQFLANGETTGDMIRIGWMRLPELRSPIRITWH